MVATAAADLFSSDAGYYFDPHAGSACSYSSRYSFVFAASYLASWQRMISSSDISGRSAFT